MEYGGRRLGLGISGENIFRMNCECARREIRHRKPNAEPPITSVADHIRLTANLFVRSGGERAALQTFRAVPRPSVVAERLDCACLQHRFGSQFKNL